VIASSPGDHGISILCADPLSSRAARKLGLPGLGFDGVAPEAAGLCPVFPRKGRNKAAKYLLKW
jgi:hypothetical protein